MRMRVSHSVALFCAMFLLLPTGARSQSTGGTIIGIVKDTTGAAVEAAEVRIVNKATDQSRSARTDMTGRYELREVPPGLYELTVKKDGFNTGKIPGPPGVLLSVALAARLDDITLTVADVGKEIVEVKSADMSMLNQETPTLSTSFSEKQIRELPILSRDLNNLALLAPGVFSVRTFSFASTLVPFAANGSRGRDNNFIIDSVDNNEPLFGGAATQFTNPDLFDDYQILTNQYQAEYGRNSGSVVNIITQQGGNKLRGTLFWFGQHDALNATNKVEKLARLTGPTRFYENQIGGTLGGPLKRDSTWFFLSYQWDRARNDLSPVYPLISTLPTSGGLAALKGIANPRPTLAALLADPTVSTLPGLLTPCGFPLPNNPCTTGNPIPVGTQLVTFGTFLVPRAGVFDVRDHQASFRIDQKIGERDNLYARYLFDDLLTPRTTLGSPTETAFADFGVLPQWRALFAQRTQSFGAFWTHSWINKLNELRLSYSRISSEDGALDASQADRERPALTIGDSFALSPSTSRFPAAGRYITIGRDSRSTRVNSNLYQVQENFSVSLPRHSLKFGVNFVRTLSGIRQISANLGHYFYDSFSDFVNDVPNFAWQRFGNFHGRGGEVLPLREFAQYYFVQDDIRLASNFTLNLGLRYEKYSQAFNRISELNPNYPTLVPTVRRKDNERGFAPRIGFAWGLGSKSVIRGGYGIYYNPTFFNIALLAWQSGPISPFVFGKPSPRLYPNPPFTPDDARRPRLSPEGCSLSDNPPPNGTTFVNCTDQNTVSNNLANPYVQSFSLSLQRQLGNDFLVQVAYVGSKGTRLFQRLDVNPFEGWANPGVRYGPRTRSRNRGDITQVTNGGSSIYHALQISGSKRLRRAGFWNGIALSAAYTWSHMIDNASEIFGPGLAFVGNSGGDLNEIIGRIRTGQSGSERLEAISAFPQDSSNAQAGERGNSSFDRRHRLALSFLWALPAPESRAARAFFGNWEFNGFLTVQSGQPFSPLNGFRNSCIDAGGDGIPTNDRPSIGNPNAPANTVALLKDLSCIDTRQGYTADPSTVRFVQVPRGVRPGETFTVGGKSFVAGNAGRNILTGPGIVNFDFAVFKNFLIGERRNLQFRVEFYDLFNHLNPGYPFGNVFTTNAQLAPAVAFAPGSTPARATGLIPENAIDASDPGFLSQRYMNTSSRRIQLALKLIF